MTRTRRLDDWLQAFLVYTNSAKSPEEFFRWAGISAISSALRRHVWFNMNFFRYYPSTYVVLVAPPGKCAKSTVLDITEGFVRSTEQIAIGADSSSRERLIDDMAKAYDEEAEQSALTIYSKEFATLFRTSQMGMVELLIELFDCKPSFEHRTNKGGIVRIEKPYLAMLAATTPTWIATGMPFETIGIGLPSRIIFVHQDKSRVRKFRPPMTSDQAELMPHLIHDLTQICTLRGEYDWESPELEVKMDDWFANHSQAPNTAQDMRLDGYYERKPDHLVKLCMILAASRRDELVITEQDYHDAHEILAYTEDSMPKVFAHVGRNPLSHDTALIADMILEGGAEGVRVSDIMSRFKHSLRPEELLEVFTSLSMEGLTARRGDKIFALAYINNGANGNGSD